MDMTENVRREMTAIINSVAEDRLATEAKYGQCWNTEELQQDFDVLGFAAPFVIVRRKSDSVKGSMMFQHSPRLYFKFDAA